MRRLICAWRIGIEGLTGVLLLINLGTSLAISISRKVVLRSPDSVSLMVWTYLLVVGFLCWDTSRLIHKLKRVDAYLSLGYKAFLPDLILQKGKRRLVYETGFGLLFLSFSIAGLVGTTTVLFGQPPDPFSTLGGVYEDGPPPYTLRTERWRLIGDSGALVGSACLLWHTRRLRRVLKLAEEAISNSTFG